MEDKILALFIISVIATAALSSAQTATREDIYTFLKKDLKNYFDGKPTILTGSELKGLLKTYTSSSTDIDLDKTSLSPSAKEVLLKEIAPQKETQIREEENKKKYNELCKSNAECITNRCVNGGFFDLYRSRCGYSSNLELKGSKESCKKNEECFSGKCANSFCFIICSRNCK